MKLKRNEVRTRRLVLRPLKASDYEVWLNAYTQRRPSQNKWDTGPYDVKKCSKAMFTKIMKLHSKLAGKDEYYWYGVFQKKTGQLIGHIDFDVYVRRTHQFANFGYQIYNPFWGHGFGQEATKAGLKIGFQNLKLNRLEAAINLDNRKSIRLAKAIGMQREGIKKRYWFENDQWVDHLVYVANPEDIGLRARTPF